MAVWSFFKTVLASLFVVIYADVGVAKELAPRDGDISQSWSPLLSPEALQTLSDHLPDTQIIDIRSQKRASKGVVPGSVLMPYRGWRGPKDRPGQPPTEQQLEEYLAEAGLRLDLPIAIVNHSGSIIQSGQASYIYWLLKTAGVQNVAILNGGFKAWARSGQEIADEPSVLEPSFVSVDYKYDWWADPMDIFGVSSGQTHGFILDARLDAQSKRADETGKPMMSMPMAQLFSANLFTNYLSNKDLSAKGLDEFRSLLTSRGIELNDDLIISICQTGELSALSWFYASEIAEIENIRYYPDALQGWKSDGGKMFGLSRVSN